MLRLVGNLQHIRRLAPLAVLVTANAALLWSSTFKRILFVGPRPCIIGKEGHKQEGQCHYAVCIMPVLPSHCATSV